MPRPPLALAVVLLAVAAAAAVALGWRPMIAGDPAPIAPTGDPTPIAPTGGASPDATAALEPAPAGDEWSAVEWLGFQDNPVGPSDPLRRIDGLIATGSGYLGWGKTPVPGRNQFGDMGAVFLSADGVAWRTVPVAHGVEAANASTLMAVAEGADGLLAVGSVCCDPERPAVWHSPDGTAWTRLAIGGDLEPAGAWLNSVVATPDGWALIAQRHDGSSAVFASSDGADWEMALEVDTGRPGVGLRDIARTADGLVAVGVVVAEDGSYDAGVWLSADGRAWERRGADAPALTEDEVQPWRVVGHAGGLFMTGVLGTKEERIRCEGAAAMIASLDALPPPPGPPATSCVSGRDAIWISPDGETWELAAPGPGMQPIEFRVMAAAGTGLVVLGETSGPGSPDTALFGSADGAAWQLLADVAPMRTGVARAMAVRGDEILAITEHWDGATSTIRAWRGHAR